MTTTVTAELPGVEQTGRRISPSLDLLARVARLATSRPSFASLPIQFASALGELAEYLWIRGESHVEHYYAEALALGCVAPASSDIRGYEMLLVSFSRFDRRRPALPAAEHLSPLTVSEQHCVHFIQSLRGQRAFQACYDAALQIDAYGAMDHSRKKLERIVLLSRELTGQPLLARPSGHEEMYLTLAMQAS